LITQYYPLIGKEIYFEMDANDLKIGITLSGGGVRAAAFHLGVLSRLADEGLLEKIKMLSTVSGGSLVTGLIYHSNGNKWPNSEEFKEKCVPHVKHCLVERNLQLNALVRMIFWPFPVLFKGRASVISSSIRYCWGIKSKLNSISAWPRWDINATAIESGKSWRFIPNNRMGDYILNYVEKPDISLSDSLCSSAAVPFLIGPLKLRTGKYKWYKYDETGGKVSITPNFSKIHIWDGGAYDNLGIEPLVKFNNGLEYRDEFNFLMVSDAALAIGTERRNWFNPMRLIDVTMDQVRSLRARALWDHFQNNGNTGVYFKIGDSIQTIREASGKGTDVSGFGNNNLPNERLDELKTYPTTLWKMKERDFNDLFQHGWEVANTSLVSYCPSLFSNQIKA
jgi:NTE family protein